MINNIGAISRSVILSLSLFAAHAHAQTTTRGLTDISVLPMAGPNMSDVVIDSNLTLNNGSTTYLDIYVSCYGTNLRSVANPVSPASNITAKVRYISSDGSTKYYSVKFPAGLAMKEPPGIALKEITSETTVKNSADVSTSEVFRTQMQDSMIRVAMSSTKTVGLDTLASGTDYGAADPNSKSSVFTGITFDQEMPAGTPVQQFMGWTGPLTASVRWYFAENAKSASVYASFPGQNHYCGGYFSPLMLKFKATDTAPKMLGRSNFPLSVDRLDNPPKISWPSFLKAEDVYFLVLDSNGNKKADDGSELLGDINGYENGFANLAIYDENKDGVIDEKDAVFAKLLLWKDSNHNGKSEKSEMKTLKELGVKSISLEYQRVTSYVNESAKIMGPGSFKYVDKKGQSQTGTVWDVFMKVVPK
jgi:hypothetical protein